MKQTLIFIFLLCSLSAFAQTVSYSIDTVRRDSFFLVETVKADPTADAPRPAITQNAQLFRSYEQVSGFVDYLRKQAVEAETKAREAEKTAQEQRAAQKRIEQAANKIESAIKSAKPFFEDKPPAKATSKTTKKGKQ